MHDDDRHDGSIGCGAIMFGLVLSAALWGWILGIVGRMR